MAAINNPEEAAELLVGDMLEFLRELEKALGTGCDSECKVTVFRRRAEIVHAATSRRHTEQNRQRRLERATP